MSEKKENGKSAKNVSGDDQELYPWVEDAEACLKVLDVDIKKGKSKKEIEELLKIHGYNELVKEEGKGFWEMVIEQFEDSLVRILLVAAVVSALIAVNEAYEQGHSLTIDKFVEPLVILMILILNAIVGVWQESSAEKSLEALMEMQSDIAKVLRDGEWISDLEARLLVPGDIIDVRQGDRVPADCRVAQLLTTTLRAEQMALTGESVAVLKQSEVIDTKSQKKSPSEIEIQSKLNMLFSGTTISNGHAYCVVTATGMKTEIGKIQDQLKKAAEETAEEKTPLKQKLDDFSDQLQYMIGMICLLVWIINFRMFIFFEPINPSLPFVPNPATLRLDYKKAIYYFQIAVALAVAAIPEGLPTVITMCLALGTRRMAKRNCIVRHLPAVETLGCTTIICSDKTGTLTTNQMSVRRIVTLGDSVSDPLSVVEVDGTTYDPKEGKATIVGKKSPIAVLEDIAKICVLCNDASIEVHDGAYKHVGAPTEAALLVAVEKLASSGLISTSGNRSSAKTALPTRDLISSTAQVYATLEFTRERKSMSVIARDQNQKGNCLYVKGAPESILDRCAYVRLANSQKVKITEDIKKKIAQEIDGMAQKAWRTLALAVLESEDIKGDILTYDGSHSHPAHKLLINPEQFANIEAGLTWIGAVAMQDPPRPEVRNAIKACNGAGIRVVVITGDNKATADAIARDIGVFTADEDISRKSFIGSDFSALPEEEQIKILWSSENVSGSLVFSRAEPKFKQDLVKLLKKGNKNDEHGGEIVAMTGDGVNDAPALKMADIGIAMGITGTEVAKEASDMVLVDDNFNSIVSAVEEGRAIYSNMKAFIRYMISSNVGEVASIFLTAALGFPEGMIPVQLLWINLVTDGPPATALGFNKSDPDILRKPPRKADDVLISGWTMFRFLIIGCYVGIATVGIFAAWYTHGIGGNRYFLGLDLGRDGHSAVTLEMLMHHHSCDLKTNVFDLPSGKIEDFSKHTTAWTANGLINSVKQEVKGCDYFSTAGRMKASTLSLSVVVMIEMFNAMNALSEDNSILVVTPLSNPFLLLAITISFTLHGIVLWIPAISPYFSVVPLDWQDLVLVFYFSIPVIFIDEGLKLFSRMTSKKKSSETPYLKKVQ